MGAAENKNKEKFDMKAFSIPTQYFPQLFKFAVDFSLLTMEDFNKITKYKIKYKANKKNQKNLNTFLQSFLMLPDSFSCTWAEIFHTRLVRDQTILGKYIHNYFLTKTKIIKIKKL